MKMLLLVAAVATLMSSRAQAAGPELSIDARRMLAYATLTLMTRACGTAVPADQAAQMQTEMEKAAEAQQDLSQADFAEAMKAAGKKVGENKAQICGALTPDFITSGLKDAAAGDY